MLFACSAVATMQTISQLSWTLGIVDMPDMFSLQCSQPTKRVIELDIRRSYISNKWPGLVKSLLSNVSMFYL